MTARTMPAKCVACHRTLATEGTWRHMTAEQRAGKAAYAAHGVCRSCYKAARRRHRPTCAVPECEKRPYSRRWCGMHYQRWRRYGDPAKGGRGPLPTPLDPDTLARLRRQVGLPETGPTPEMVATWCAQERDELDVAS